MDQKPNPKKELENEIPQKQLDLERAYDRLFKTEDGETVLYDMMKRGYFLSPTMGATPQISDRNEGQRELVLYVLAMTKRDSVQTYEKIQQMSENNEKDII